MAEKWIGKAIKHPGALRRAMGVGEGKTISKERLEAAKKKLMAVEGKMSAAQRTRLRQVSLALTLAKFRGKKSRASAGSSASK